MTKVSSQENVPTVVFFGTPGAEDLKQIVEKRGWGLVVDNGKARDPVFTIYENFARADAFVATPNANPIHLLTLLAEAEVGHPLILEGSAGPNPTEHFKTKPIIFLGTPEQWKPFQAIFNAMKAQGVVRDGFDRLASYCSNPREACDTLYKKLPHEIPSTRVNYYLHTKKGADLEISRKGDVRPPADVTVACFGSASTKNPAHLERTDDVARMLSRRDFNILHGGGSGGVMGQLSKSAQKYKAYVKGVTVHSSGAPKIFFERDAGDQHPEEIDLHIASKDMIHRIESYAGHSEAFIALDGGLGTAQEILIVADLIACRHPVMMYEGKDGNLHPKPLLVLNESGVFSPLLEYLESCGLHHLRSQILDVSSVVELEAGLVNHMTLNPPLKHDSVDPDRFRERYGGKTLPTVVLPPMPDLKTLDLGQEPPRSRENGELLH